MFPRHPFFLASRTFSGLALLPMLLLVGCTEGEDETISVTIPPGYSAATQIPDDSWQEKMKRIMAHGLESEALAAETDTTASTPAPAPALSKGIKPLAVAKALARPDHARRGISHRGPHARKAKAIKRTRHTRRHRG